MCLFEQSAEIQQEEQLRPKYHDAASRAEGIHRDHDDDP